MKGHLGNATCMQNTQACIAPWATWAYSACCMAFKPCLACMQVMSVWPFKQMILRAQLKQTPAIPARIDSHETGSSSSSSAAAPKSLPTAAQPSSAQPASSDISRDLVQEQRPGGDSPPQASAEAPADSAATQACASEQPQGLHKGQEGAHSSSAVQSSPGMQPKTAGAHGRYSEPLQTDYIFHFGDTTEIRKALEMPNRLTGYAIFCLNMFQSVYCSYRQYM